MAYHAKKKLGQNFLKSQEIIQKIIDLVEPVAGKQIVEIGPGRGALTVPLAESGAEVWAVEFDRDLIGYLSKLLGRYDNVKILNVDFLSFEPDAGQLPEFTLVGNLPFNITSPVVDWCVKYYRRMDKAILMVQRELAARLAASPGGKAWSPLSIFAQLLFTVEICFDVPPTSFVPAPDVTSAVVCMTPHPGPLTPPEPGFEKVVRESFKHRRKTLLNNLVPGIIPTSEQAHRIFTSLSLGHECRAEEMSIEQFLNLTNCLNDHKLL